jgi:hypothetical protein
MYYHCPDGYVVVKDPLDDRKRTAYPVSALVRRMDPIEWQRWLTAYQVGMYSLLHAALLA